MSEPLVSGSGDREGVALSSQGTATQDGWELKLPSRRRTPSPPPTDTSAAVPSSNRALPRGSTLPPPPSPSPAPPGPYAAARAPERLLAHPRGPCASAAARPPTTRASTPDLAAPLLRPRPRLPVAAGSSSARSGPAPPGSSAPVLAGDLLLKIRSPPLHSPVRAPAPPRPTFDGRGLVPPVPTGAPAAPKPVELSSDESHGEEEGEEEDSEVTPEGTGETSPLSKADILRTLPNDAEADARQEKEKLPVIPTRGRSSLVSRDDTPALAPSGAASGPSIVMFSAPGACAPAPQASKLSGFKLTKRRAAAFGEEEEGGCSAHAWDRTICSGHTPLRGERKRQLSYFSDPVALAKPRGALSGGVTPEAPLVLEVSMSGLAVEVPEAQEPLISQALATTSPLPPAAPLLPGSSFSSAVLERALSEMTQLREDLLGADPRLVAGCLELASGWLQSDAAVRAALSQAAMVSEKEKRAAAQSTADREAALKDTEAAHDRCRALEDELKSLRDLHAEEARSRQAKEKEMRAREDTIKDRDAELGELAKAQTAERGRLEELEQEVKAREVDLDAKAKVLAEDHEAFALLEKRSRVALKVLYEKGLEKPLTTDEDGPAQLLPYLVAALDEVVAGIGPMAEAEARVLSSAAPTRVFSHLHLHDPTARLDELLESVDEEHCAAVAAAVKD
nr:nascent polypeptide-associated complex subunit alpha, muscle-specific form-like [Aegilops tauschii subsp. strangulata]